jgi:hypothetical protein
MDNPMDNPMDDLDVSCVSPRHSFKRALSQLSCPMRDFDSDCSCSPASLSPPPCPGVKCPPPPDEHVGVRGAHLVPPVCSTNTCTRTPRIVTRFPSMTIEIPSTPSDEMMRREARTWSDAHVRLASRVASRKARSQSMPSSSGFIWPLGDVSPRRRQMWSPVRMSGISASKPASKSSVCDDVHGVQ